MQLIRCMAILFSIVLETATIKCIKGIKQIFCYGTFKHCTEDGSFEKIFVVLTKRKENRKIKKLVDTFHAV